MPPIKDLPEDVAKCSDQGEYFLHVKVDWIIGSAGD